VLPTELRDALVALLNGPGGQNTPRTAAPATGSSTAAANAQMRLPTQALVLAASAENSIADAAAAHALASSGALRSARNEAVRAPAQATPFEAPVLDPREPGATAVRLAARVAGSGVFSKRTSRSGCAAIAALKPCTAKRNSSRAPPSPIRRARRRARRCSSMRCIGKRFPWPARRGWGNRCCSNWGAIRRFLPDGANGASENAQPVFVARLRLDLPRLGCVEIRLRLAGEAIAATVASSGATRSMAELERALPEFASALAARGLRPVLLQVLAPAEWCDGRPSSRRHAAALAYHSEDARRSRAPRVTARGQGLVADEIIETGARGRSADSCITRAVRTAHPSRPRSAHSPALYVAVAEVLAWVYRLEGRAAPRPQRN